MIPDSTSTKFAETLIAVLGAIEVPVLFALTNGEVMSIVKSDVLVPVKPAVVTVIGPVVAPEGTVVVIEVIVLAVTIATVPLNLTVLAEGVALKLVPEIVTDAPVVAIVGLNPMI